MASLESFVGPGRVFLVEVQHHCQSGMGLLWKDFVQEIMGWISGGAERQPWAHHGGEKLTTGCFGIRDYGSIMMPGSKSQRLRRRPK